MSYWFGSALKSLVSAATVGLYVLAGASAAAPAGTYEILKDRSLVSILVYRGGFLQPFGHNHVISSRALHGTIQWQGSGARTGRFSLQLPMESLEVDRKDDRAAQGTDFSTEVDDSARKATRRNMLGPKVLDYPRFNRIRASGVFDGNALHTEIDLHGMKRKIVVPVRIQSTGEVLSADGAFPVDQSEFNIEPFRAVGGLLRIRDRIEIRFHIVARLAGR
ncbi:MAG: YceI family protein [Acidiferrobacteraceae bacterium]|jgi:hypothetical protein